MNVLLKMPQPDRIPYFDKPPALGGELTYLTPEQFKEKFGCEYTESILVSEKQPLDKIHALKAERASLFDPADIERRLLEFMENPKSLLAIGFIDDKVGHGVFALEDIPAGTILCVYAGELTKKSTDESTAYEHHVAGDFAVAAEKYRGMSGFMQDSLPDHGSAEPEFLELFKNKTILADYLDITPQQLEEAIAADKIDMKRLVTNAIKRNRAINPEFDSIQFLTPEIRSSVATDNVTRCTVSFRGVPMQVMVARTKICRDEAVVYSYNPEYWLNRPTPELFFRSGRVVPHSLYKRTSDPYLRLTPTNSTEQHLVKDTVKSFLEDIADNLPIDQNGESYSIYDLRNQLHERNRVSDNFAEQANPHYIQLMTDKWFSGKNITVKTFWRNPIARESQPEEITSHTADMVCRAADDAGLKELQRFLRPIRQHARFFSETREIVIPGINIPENTDVREFIKSKAFTPSP